MTLASLFAVAALAEPLPVRFEMDDTVEFDLPADDVFGMGQRVAVRAGIADNAFVMGEELAVDGPVGGDVFSMGQEVRIRGPVDGDVYALAGDVIVEATGSVAGHVRALAGDVRLEGPVGGDVEVAAGILTLGSAIGGSVRAEVGEVVVRDGAAVAGDLSYEAPARVPEIEERVAGAVTFTEPVDDEPEPAEESSWLSAAAGWTLWRAWGYGTRLLVGATLVLVGAPIAGRVARTLVDQPARSLGLGFAAASVLAMGSLLALVTIVPFPLGLVGLALLALGLYVGQLVAAQALGDVVLKRFRPGAWGSPVLSMAVGLVPLVLVYALPWVGSVAWFVATMFGLGAIWLHLRSASA